MGTGRWRRRLGFVFLFLLMFFPISLVLPGEKDDTAQIAKETRWGRHETLMDHYRRHGADFGAGSPREYAEMAFVFFKKAKSEKFLTKTGQDGTIRIYDPKTNTFGAYHRNGKTKTFFKPKDGVKYWKRQ